MEELRRIPIATLNIKNFPDGLYESLRERAKREHRSVAQEVIHLLERATAATEAHSIRELRGLGKELWGDIDPAAHVEAERRGWDPQPVADLVEALRPGPVALDTAIFIYFIEEHPRFMPLLEPLFEAIEAAHVLAVTSALSLLETLVVPFRAGDRALTLRYESILTQSQGLTLVELTVPVLKRAAELRASAGLKTPDAIQLAAALSAGCTAFLSNDRRISSAQRLRVFQLDDFVSKRIKDQ